MSTIVGTAGRAFTMVRPFLHGLGHEVLDVGDAADVAGHAVHLGERGDLAAQLLERDRVEVAQDQRRAERSREADPDAGAPEHQAE